jgi:hypothetical protein
MSDGVFYRERGLLSSNETKIPFDQITDELVRAFHVPRLYQRLVASITTLWRLTIGRLVWWT